MQKNWHEWRYPWFNIIQQHWEYVCEVYSVRLIFSLFKKSLEKALVLIVAELY